MQTIYTAGLASILLVASLAVTRAQDLMVMHQDRYYIGFEVDLFGLFSVDGQFQKASGTMRYDQANPAASNVHITVQTASIDTNLPIRDDELRSVSFFDVKNHPTMVFESLETVVKGDASGTVIGKLTIKGITNKVALHVKARDRRADPTSSGKGSFVTSFEASGMLRPADFGLRGGDAQLTLRADFVKCAGKVRAEPACQASTQVR
ncbi:MAG: YceI family protein [Filomicrobium sp.]